ncbi:MAG: phosphotriesterase [Dehalococcoidia bacterium]
MGEVQTATGPVDHRELGITLSHEHLLISSPGLRHSYAWMTDAEAEVDHIARELEEAKAAGVRTIIDVTTPDLGREAGLVRIAAERAGVHVVIATGIWLDIPRAFAQASVDDLAALFTREIEVGVGEADCRAGVIKVANSDPPGVGELERRVLRAAARAAMRTGVPVTTHTGPYTIGREQMRVFAEEGLPPHLAAVGHSFTDDVGYLEEVLARGHYLSVDHFGQGREHEARVIDAIARLCAAGHAARIMLGHDHVPEASLSSYWPWGGHLEHRSPSLYTHVVREAVPALRRAGVANADIDRMLVEAPASFLLGGRPV